MDILSIGDTVKVVAGDDAPSEVREYDRRTAKVIDFELQGDDGMEYGLRFKDGEMPETGFDEDHIMTLEEFRRGVPE